MLTQATHYLNTSIAFAHSKVPQLSGPQASFWGEELSHAASVSVHSLPGKLNS